MREAVVLSVRFGVDGAESGSKRLAERSKGFGEACRAKAGRNTALGPASASIDPMGCAKRATSL